MKVFIFGLSGRMGCALVSAAADRGYEVTGGFDRVRHPSIPTFTDAAAIDVDYDVIIDFSLPATLDALIAAATAKGVPVVIATTGYTPDEQKKIEALSRKVPVLQSGNMSVGVNVLLDLVGRAARALGEGYDIEIVEKHHNLKKDAPSGTALMLAESANAAFSGEKKFTYGREGMVGARDKREIGIHAVRGGTIVGEHEVMFAGEDEILTLSHSARSKKVFAAGAIAAAKFMKGRPAGKYDMQDVLA